MSTQHRAASSAKDPAADLIVHPLPPIWDERSRVLILGSFPSVRSRADAFYYAHPQNRFWRVLAAVFDAPVPQTVSEKTAFLHEHGLALWDVVGSCRISGSSDSSIRQAEPNPVDELLRRCGAQRVAVNGGTAARLYDRYLLSRTGLPAVRLPSTSPANASWSLERLTEAWRAALR